jgi:IclR family transcriptional regulator, pca regulon regulatory protein
VPEADRRDRLQTLERGLEVLVAFADRGPWLTLGELVTATGLTKPTIRRVLLTLEAMGYARIADNRYALTPRVLRLGYAYLSSVDLPRLAQPIMESLTGRCQLSSSLGAMDGTDVVYINRIQPHRRTAVNLAIGTRMPAHATSMGHVLLAGLPLEALHRYLKEAELVPLTHNSYTSATELERHLDVVRRLGWAAVDQQVEIGRRAAAAPIIDSSGQVVAALALSSDTSGQTFSAFVDQVLQQLLDSAQQISQLIGSDANLTRPTHPRTT